MDYKSSINAPPEGYEWRCSGCGAVLDWASPQWRWNGEIWQHYDGYPIGHVDAVLTPTAAATA